MIIPDILQKRLMQLSKFYDNFKKTKVGNALNNFFNGVDSNLSNEEYFNKHGYNKPIIGIPPPIFTGPNQWVGLNGGLSTLSKEAVGFNRQVPGFIKNVESTTNTIQKNANVATKVVKKSADNLKEVEALFLKQDPRRQKDTIRYVFDDKYSSIEELKRNTKDWIKLLKLLKKK